MDTPPADRRLGLTAQVVVFLAGFTFLIYEVSWNRLLALVLGATVAASTVVLAAFMAGLGAGAYFWSRRACESRPPERLLGALLAGVGALSALDYLLFVGGAAAPVVAALLLALPSFLMGGVLPVVSRIAIGSDAAIAPTLGRLYALETLGSSLGGLGAGFVLLGQLGQRGTLAVAIVIDLVLGVWLLARRPLTLAAPAREPRREAPADPATLRRAALAGTLVCGFAMVGLQVLWLRAFRVYLTNTSYTFALVSSLAILGLFAGSAWFRRRAPGPADLRRVLARVIVLMAVTVGLGLVLLVKLPEALMFPLQGIGGNPLARVLLVPALATLLIVVPPAVCSGYAFPLACRMYAAGVASIGRDVGRVLLVNTVGSTVGPVVAAFVLIPRLGAAWSIALIAAGLAAAALVFLRGVKPAALDRGLALATLAVLALTALARPDLRIVPPSFSRFDRQILFYRESVEGTLTVGQDRGTRSEAKYSFVNNSAVIGSSYDAVKAVKMVGNFPFYLGLDGGDVLVIGFGIGVTTSAIASHPQVRSIECVELVDGLREAAVYYRDLNRNVTADPRLRFIAGDGRHYLQRSNQKYDLISCDPTHPVFGSASLYTREYFELCRRHLDPGGMVSQYLPLHKLRTEEFLGLIATFHDVFPNCAVFLGHYHAVLVGSLAPLAVDFADWIARVRAGGPDKDVYVDPYHFAATLVLDGPAIARLTAGSRINTDDRSYTEFFAPRCLDEGNLAINLRFLNENRVDPAAFFRGVADPARLARFVAGNEMLTQSLLAGLAGDQKQGLALLRQACEVSPDDRELPFLIRLNY